MVWKPCSACCRALGLLWHKVRDTKRVHRGRRGRRERDVELGELSSTSRDGTGRSSSSSSSSDDDDDRRRGAAASSRLRGRSLSSSSLSVRERRKDRIRQSLRLKRVSSKVERAARVSQGSGRRHRHSSSTGAGPRRAEVPPSLSLSSRREHGHGSPARGHKPAHGRTLRSSHGDSTRQNLMPHQ
ncbi:uncharacterized protein LOC120695187 [Panicum virgatum]|nr:uncharacterized protein LOC120695187 [Panicum virgatum]